MKNRRRKIVMFVLLFSLPVFAQKQANNWFFGRKAGLTWNTTQTVTGTAIYGTTEPKQLSNIPTNLPGSQMTTSEGCFSLSDEEGNLLFYSSGMAIWNRNHQVMQNGTGLTGHDSSAQSGIIVPYPGSKTKYIAVCIGQYGQSTNQGDRAGRLTYSVIDMTLDNGLGAVIEKNIPLINFNPTIGESITSIRHANGRDFWIVAPARGRNPYLNAWLATPEGIVADTPVISAFPLNSGTTGDVFTASGYIKFSPDGKHFAWATNFTSQLFVGSFDTRTGKMTKSQTLRWNHAYGVEFSNSGKYLYVRAVNALNYMRVYEFEDLLAHGEAVTKKLEINNTGTGSLQMGPDGRIYLNMVGNNFMYIIDNPEEMNNLRIYRVSSMFTGSSELGLPSFAASWFAIDDFKSTICLGEDAVYRVSSSTGKIMIDFDEGEGKQIMDVPLNGEIRHRFKKPGAYLVTVELYGAATLEPQTAYTTVYSCYVPVNHNLSNLR
ncbi:hypothetical protein [Myroides sp. DW712]|uniref:YncE family protein n=1 Tax=Myroides sp. DW712 TaxID=3389800 RepID=UPI00397AC47E